jgi:hypothetical protein
MSITAMNLVLQAAWGVMWAWALGVIALMYGRALVQNPDRVMWINDWIAIELVRRLKGEEAAVQKERDLLKPERVQKIGRQNIVAGCILIVLGVLDLLIRT